MSLIKDILGLSGTDRTNSTIGSKNNNKLKSAKADKSSAVVKTDISPEAKHLLELKNEASKYLDKVKDAETLSPEQIDQIKERISSQYYFDSQVIDQIVEKMLRTVRLNRIK